ncbi:MAG: hypothetical protein K6G85_04585 [Eubacterium sp.]|nr:hypothetical protein [Eubacterium sp.]
MRKSFKKVVAYACVASMAFAGFAGFSGNNVKAEEEKEVTLELWNGENKITGEQSVSGDYAYQGNFHIPDGTPSNYTVLEITYTGDISTLRLESPSNVTWFADNAQGTFKTVDDSTITLNAQTETTVSIDLVKTGVTYSAGDYIHLHAGGGYDFKYELKSVKLKEGKDSPEVTSGEATTLEEIETTPVNADDIILNGDENGMSSMIKNFGTISAEWKYLGFATLKEPTPEYKYLIITYAGDIGSVRFEFAAVDAQGTETAKSAPYWFNGEGQENFFVTADGSEIPLDGGKGTTIVIDLEKTGIDLSTYNSVHMHAGYGAEAKEFSFRIGMARLSKSAEISGSDVLPPVQTTTKKETTTTKKNEVKKPGKAVVKKATKKKSAKSISVQLKKVSKAKGYVVAVYASEKNAKKNKKAIVTFKKVKKTKVTLKSKKLSGKKKLFVRARAFVLKTNGKRLYGDWSKVKKVTIKK